MVKEKQLGQENGDRRAFMEEHSLANYLLWSWLIKLSSLFFLDESPLILLHQVIVPLYLLYSLQTYILHSHVDSRPRNLLVSVLRLYIHN